MQQPIRTKAYVEAIFLAQLPTIERVTSSLARQHRLSAADAEDFTAEVHLRLISDDYAVLRQFRSQCTLRTFLTVVIRRLFLDYRNAQWGKWRPSVHSVRAGHMAVQLEELTVRDGFTFSEACDILQTNEGRPVDRNALLAAYRRFRRRSRPRFVNDEAAAARAAAASLTDERLVAAEAQRVVERTTTALRCMLITVPRHERLILKLHFVDGLSVAKISRRLGVDQKALYRRIQRLLAGLRARLESEGLVAADVLAAATRPDTNFALVFPPDDFLAIVRRAVRTELMPTPESASGSPGSGTVSAA
jgi:RNA polymerase sigma factor (sigma-70 family)